MEAIEEPILKGIVPAVLIAGLLFYYGRTRAQKAMATILDKVSIKIIIFFYNRYPGVGFQRDHCHYRIIAPG